MRALEALAVELEQHATEDTHAVAARRNAQHVQNIGAIHLRKLGWGGAANDS